MPHLGEKRITVPGFLHDDMRDDLAFGVHRNQDFVAAGCTERSGENASRMHALHVDSFTSV